MFVFPAGTVNVAHKATADSQPKFNLKACTATFTEDGTFQPKGGTGKYAHASGYGRYHLNGLLVLQRKHHKCDTNMNDAAEADRHQDQGRREGDHRAPPPVTAPGEQKGLPAPIAWGGPALCCAAGKARCPPCSVNWSACWQMEQIQATAGQGYIKWLPTWPASGSR